MPGTDLLLNEKVFLNRSMYQEAERLYSLRKHALDVSGSAKSSLDAKMSQLSLDGSVEVSALVERLHRAEAESIELKSKFQLLESRVAALEGGKAPAKSAAAAPAPAKPAPAKPAKNDDDFDLFEEDAEEDTEEKKRITEERLKAYNAKKSNKPTLIAKSSVLLDVKVWDDETDMAALEKSVRGIVMDGLVWGSSKLVPVAYGVKKLQIQCVIEDDKVSTEALEEQICAFDDYVQSVDIAAFNKI